MRIDPIRSEIEHAAVVFDRIRQQVRRSFAVERGLEKIFRRGAGHRVELGAGRRRIERENPLLLDRAERAGGARRDHQHIAALLEELQGLKGQRRFAELLFDERDGATHALRGNAIFGESLHGSQGDEVAKAVETLSPARLGTDQPQAFPVAQAVRIHTQDAPHLFSRISLRQAWRSLSSARVRIDYPPYVNRTQAPFL